MNYITGTHCHQTYFATLDTVTSVTIILRQWEKNLAKGERFITTINLSLSKENDKLRY